MLSKSTRYSLLNRNVFQKSSIKSHRVLFQSLRAKRSIPKSFTQRNFTKESVDFQRLIERIPATTSGSREELARNSARLG